VSGQIDVSNECEFKEGKANPFGWSQYEVHHGGRRIGWIESGNPMHFVEPYSYELVPEGSNVRLVVWKKAP
jgi:hypothetical protein